MSVLSRVANLRLGALYVWQQDLLIVASSVGLGALLYAIGLYPLSDARGISTAGWLHLVLFGVICVAELFRRRAPVSALLAGVVLLLADGFLGFSMPMWIVFADLLYSATLYGSRRLSNRMMLIATLSTMLAVLAALIFATDWRVTIIAGLSALAAIVIPVAWAGNIRQHQERAESERTHADQLVKINELDRSAAVAAERARMARDLHDVVSGHLSAIAIQSEAALSMDDADPETLRTALGSVRENSVRGLEEMRAMVDVLRGDSEEEMTAPAGLAELSQLVESAKAAGMRIELRSELDESVSLPAAVDLTAYRIAQEALTNATKHAPRTRAWLDVQHDDRVLTVEVVNEISADPGTTTDTGTGLLNMRERAAAVGGSLSAGPSESGWQVRAVLPVTRVGA